MTSSPLPTIKLNAWQLRCIWRYSSVEARVTSGELACTMRKRNKPDPISKNPNHPQDTRSRHLMYTDKNGDEVATAHVYECGGTFVTRPDRKTITIRGVRYVIHPQDLDANPEKRLRWIRLMRLYGSFMKLNCRLFGPIDVIPQSA